MTKRMIVSISDELHRQIKEQSFREGTTMAKIIIAAIKSGGPRPTSAPPSKVEPGPVRPSKVEPVLEETGDILMDGVRYFLKVPVGVVERVGLTVGNRLYFTATATKQRFIEASTGSKSGLAGDVTAEKDGTLSVSITSEVAEKLGFDRWRAKINWRVSGADIRLYIVEG